MRINCSSKRFTNTIIGIMKSEEMFVRYRLAVKSKLSAANDDFKCKPTGLGG